MNDRHEKSRAAFEEAHTDFDKTKNKDVGLESFPDYYYHSALQHMWLAWCRALDYAAEQQAKQDSEHVCEMHMDMMGTCFVCGAVNESIRQAREAEEAARPKYTGPTPLTRPDRAGWWWCWSEHSTPPRWLPVVVQPGWSYNDGIWVEAAPPPAPTGKEDRR